MDELSDKSQPEKPRRNALNWLGVVATEMRGNALWDFTKFAGYQILIYLFGYALFYFRILPAETLWIIISGILGILILPAVHLVLRRRWQLRENQRGTELRRKIGENQAQIDALMEDNRTGREKHLLEVAKLSSDHLSELEKLANQYEDLYKEKESADQKIRQGEWLLERIEEQSVAINDYVSLERFFFGSIREKPVPTVHFLFLLRNNSLFDVSLENVITGHIEFYGTELLGNVKFSAAPESIESTRFRWFNFEYRLSNEEFGLIVNHHEPAELCYDISKLVFTLKVVNRAGIKPRVLKIPNRFRVYRYDDYKASLDKFENKML